MGTNTEVLIAELLSDEDQLVHYGMKGMKWGVRKDRPGSQGKRETVTKLPTRTGEKAKTSSGSGSVKTAIKSASEKRAAQKKPAADELAKKSDDELRRIINRYDLEKRYKEATATSKSKAQKKMKDMILKGVNENAQKLISRAVAVGSAKAIDAIFGKGAGDFMVQSAKKGKAKSKNSDLADALKTAGGEFKKAASNAPRTQKGKTKNRDGSPLNTYAKDLVVRSTAESVD